MFCKNYALRQYIINFIAYGIHKWPYAPIINNNMINVLALVENYNADAQKRPAKYYYKNKNSYERRKPVGQTSLIQPFIKRIKNNGKGNAQYQYCPKGPEYQESKN